MIEDLTDTEREEALIKWWRDNWTSLLAGLVLGGAVLVGWQYWQKHRLEQADQARRVGHHDAAYTARSCAQTAGRQTRRQSAAGESGRNPRCIL